MHVKLTCETSVRHVEKMYKHFVKITTFSNSFSDVFHMFASDSGSCRFTLSSKSCSVVLRSCFISTSFLEFFEKKRSKKERKEKTINWICSRRCYFQEISILLFQTSCLQLNLTEFLKHTVGSFHLSSCPKYSRRREVRIMAAKKTYFSFLVLLCRNWQFVFLIFFCVTHFSPLFWYKEKQVYLDNYHEDDLCRPCCVLFRRLLTQMLQYDSLNYLAL